MALGQRDGNTLNNNKRGISENKIMKNNGTQRINIAMFINYVNMLLAMINTNIHSN